MTPDAKRAHIADDTNHLELVQGLDQVVREKEIVDPYVVVHKYEDIVLGV